MILRIELRRSIALWAGAAVLVVALGVLYGFAYGPWWQGTAAWTAQWTSAALWEREWLMILWPIAVGAGALQGLREHRSGMGELLATASRPSWQRVTRTAGAVAIALTAAYLLVFAVPATYLVAGGVRAFHLGWVAIVLVGVLCLVAGSWIGLGLGRTFPFVLTPPAVAVTALVLAWLSGAATASGSGGRIAMMLPSTSGIVLPFTTPSAAVNLGQSIVLLGLAATGLLLAVAASVRGRLLAVLPVALGMAIAAMLLPPTFAEMDVEDREATALVCNGPVCVTAMHQARLAAVAGPGQEALRLLARLPDAPVAVHETTVPYHDVRPRSSDVVLVGLGDPELRSATPAELTRLLLAGAGTPACYYRGELFQRELAARTVAAAWFLGELRPVPGFGPIFQARMDRLTEPAWTALRALPAPEQQARIVALRAAQLACRGDDPLAVLTR